MLLKLRKILSSKKGYTFIELIACIVILAVLSSMAIMESAPSVNESRIAQAKGDIATIQIAVEKYRYDHPSESASALSDSAIANDSALGTKLIGGAYLSHIPSKTPWGGKYSVVSGKVSAVTKSGETITID